MKTQPKLEPEHRGSNQNHHGPGIHDPNIKDWLVKHQIAADAWYVANPNLTVAETRRLERVGNALDEFLDKIA